METPTVYLENYYLAEEIQPISEGLADFIKKYSVDKIKDKFEELKQAAKKKDERKLEKVMKFAPKAPLGEVDKVAKKMVSGYDQRKQVAKSALKKTKAPDKIHDHLASLAAITTKDTQNARKAIEYMGTRIDWGEVGAEFGRGIVFDLIIVTASFVAFGYVAAGLIVFLLAIDIIFLIYNIATKRVDVYAEV